MRQISTVGEADVAEIKATMQESVTGTDYKAKYTVMLTVETFLYQQRAGKQKRSGGIGCNVDQFFDDLKVSAPPFAYLIALAMVSHFNDVSFFRKYC
jgi:hypothetical protein